MRKVLIYIGYFIASLMLFLLLVGITLNLIPDSKYKDWIVTAAESATGRGFSIENLEVKIGSSLHVNIDNVRMANADWGSQKDMLKIKRLELSFGLLNILSGKADVRTVAKQAEILVENNAEGLSNWVVGTKDAETEDQPYDQKMLTELPFTPYIREIRIDDSNLRLIMNPGSAAEAVHIKHLLIETPKKNTTLSLNAGINGHPVKFSGDLGNIAKLLFDASEPVRLTGDINGNKINISGHWGPLFPYQTLLIDVNLQIPSSARLAELIGLGKEEFGAIDISGKLSANNNTLSLNPFHINLAGLSTNLKIEGSIADLNNLKGFSITANADTSTLEHLVEQLGLELPSALPPEMELSTQISGSIKELALSDLVLVARDEGIEIKAIASIGDLLNAKKITGKLTGTIDSLNNLSRYAGLDLPRLGKLELSGDLASNEDALQLNNLDVRLDSKDIAFEVTGNVDDLLTVNGINARVKADIRSFSKQTIADLTALFKQLGTELPVKMLPQSIALSSEIKGSLKHLSLVNIQGEILDKDVKMEFSGDVGNILKSSDLSVELSLDSKSLSALTKYAGIELPKTDPLKVQAKLIEENKKNIITVQAKTGELNIDLKTVLEKLAIPKKVKIDISVNAPSISVLNKLTKITFPDKGPFNFSANFQMQETNFVLNDMKLSLDEQSASGNLSLNIPESNKALTLLNGNLDIAYLDLNFLLPKGKEEEPEVILTTPDSTPTASTAGKTDTVSNTNSDRLFSSDPILSGFLHEYEIDLAVNAKSIKFGKTSMRDVEVNVSLKDGLFKIDPIEGAAGAGNIKGYIQINGRSEIPDLEIDLSILQAPVPNLGGKLDFNAALQGKGKSIAELMASLNGQVLLVMRNGRIEGEMVKNFGSGLLSFSKEKNYTTLECGILRVNVKNGFADFNKNLAAQLTEVTWRGGGTVNLKTEEIEIGIIPKPRKGIPLSLSGTLSGLVHIGGTLKSPKVQLDPKDIAVKYAKYTAHLSTGGLTLLAEKIKDKIQANQDICKKILDGTVFSRADKEKAKETKKDAEREGQLPDQQR